ncbi:MAG TPA: hypothetical protein VN721_11805 [Flavipsychrobacter sp.]|nr:hypothetical protein [Flavipsychrobacter sp.]
MQDLIKQLKDSAGLTEDQAIKSLKTIKDYIQSKVPPMMHGLIDNFLGSQFAEAESHSKPGNNHNEDIMEKAKKVADEATGKIENLAEEAKGEVEEFAKDASEKINVWAEKAEEAAREAIDKLKEMIDEQKKEVEANKSNS